MKVEIKKKTTKTPTTEVYHSVGGGTGITLDEVIDDLKENKVNEVYMENNGELTSMTQIDEDGKKITILPKDQFGKVDDVKLNGVSVLNGENVANINISASVSNTTGTPTVIPVVNGGNVALNFSGIKGEPGDNAILLEGESPLAQVLSQATDKAITPKAVDDEFNSAYRKMDYGSIESETDILTSDNVWTNGKYMDSTGHSKTSSGWKVCADINVVGYDFVRISSCNVSSAACIIFANASGAVGTGIPGSGANTSPYYDEIIVKVPDGATRVCMSALIDEETYGTPYCLGIKTKGGLDILPKIKTEMESLIHGRTYSIHEGKWREGYIKAGGGIESNTDYCLSNEYLPVKNLRRIRKLQEPENKISVVCFSGAAADTRLGNYNYFSSDFSVLPIECNYIRIWFAHDDQTDVDDYVEITYWDGGVEERLGKVEEIANKSIQKANLLTSMGAKDLDLLVEESETVLFTDKEAKAGEYMSLELSVSNTSSSYAYVKLYDSNNNQLTEPNGLPTGKISTNQHDTEYSVWFEIPIGFAKATLYLQGTNATIHYIGKYLHKRIEDCSFVCNRIDSISFDDAYIKLLASDDEDATEYENYSMSMGNVIKMSDNLYYMYYYGLGISDDKSSDARGHILFAYSTDGFNWTRGFPNGVTPPIEGEGKEALVFENRIAEQCVFKVPDNEYPYRMIAGHSKFPPDGDWVKNMTSFWKSRDCINWEYVRKIYNRGYDTQYACIVRGSYIKCYMRIRSEVGGGHRYVGVMTIDLDGNMVSPPTLMGLRLYYNTAASVLDERREILFPTHYDPSTQEEYLSCYIIDGDVAKKVDVDFSNLLENTDKQMYFMPGIINIGEDFYVYYITRDAVHSPSAEDSSGGQGVSEIRMAKLTFATAGYPLRIRT